jgi:hypothetical protein
VTKRGFQARRERASNTMMRAWTVIALLGVGLGFGQVAAQQIPTFPTLPPGAGSAKTGSVRQAEPSIWPSWPSEPSNSAGLHCDTPYPGPLPVLDTHRHGRPGGAVIVAGVHATESQRRIIRDTRSPGLHPATPRNGSHGRAERGRSVETAKNTPPAVEAEGTGVPFGSGSGSPSGLPGAMRCPTRVTAASLTTSPSTQRRWTRAA